MHDHGPQPGHHVAGCALDEGEGEGIAIGVRYLIPNYGYSYHRI